MKKLFLRLLAQIVYRFAETTPPGVKFSERNQKVAESALALQALSNAI